MLQEQPIAAMPPLTLSKNLRWSEGLSLERNKAKSPSCIHGTVCSLKSSSHWEGLSCIPRVVAADLKSRASQDQPAQAFWSQGLSQQEWDDPFPSQQVHLNI